MLTKITIISKILIFVCCKIPYDEIKDTIYNIGDSRSASVMHGIGMGH